jgi:hypothetical protein
MEDRRKQLTITVMPELLVETHHLEALLLRVVLGVQAEQMLVLLGDLELLKVVMVVKQPTTVVLEHQDHQLQHIPKQDMVEQAVAVAVELPLTTGNSMVLLGVDHCRLDLQGGH